MAFQSVPDTAEVNMIFTMNGVIVQNVFYAELSGGYDEADLQALADKVDLAFPSTWQTEMPPEVSYVKTEVRGLAFANDIVVESTTSAGVGTATTAVLPNNVTFAIKKTSGLTGRSARGRTYWIGIPRGKLDPDDENMLLVAYADEIVANVDFVRTLIEAVPATAWEPVLVSRFADKAQRDEGKTFPWTGTTRVGLGIDTQRARLPSG